VSCQSLMDDDSKHFCIPGFKVQIDVCEYMLESFSYLTRLPYNLYCVGGDVKHCTIQLVFE